MPNSNPVSTKDTGEYPEFIIEKEHKDKVLFITSTTELIKEGWELDLLHALSLAGKPLDFDPQPDIIHTEIGKCEDLDSKRFALASIAGRIRNGGTGKPSKVKYTLKFEVGSELLGEEFTLTSTERNPTTFYTKITFKIK
jgi:hypothetical protein